MTPVFLVVVLPPVALFTLVMEHLCDIIVDFFFFCLFRICRACLDGGLQLFFFDKLLSSTTGTFFFIKTPSILTNIMPTSPALFQWIFSLVPLSFFL